MQRDDERWMRRAIALAVQARDEGNGPFGSVLVAADGTGLAEGRNTAVTDGDPTGHAELNLLKGIHARVSREALRDATLYASAEPCPMCAGAILWAGIGRVVFSVPSPRLATFAQRRGPVFSLRAADLVASTSEPTRVEGSFLEDEGWRVFEG